MLNHITFTGWDRHTDLHALATFLEECEQERVEIAVLYSSTRSIADDDRYPSPGVASEILRTAKASGQRTALHLCGSAATDLLLSANDEQVKLAWAAADLVHLADRVQVNVPETFWTDGPGKYRRAYQAARALHRRPVIVQSRDLDGWPVVTSLASEADRIVPFLFDRSAGRGEAIMGPDSVRAPMPVPGRLVGYAGGFNPDNVADFMRYVYTEGHGERIWIDMETGIRERLDSYPGGPKVAADVPAPTQVSIAKCRAVMDALAPWLRP